MLKKQELFAKVRRGKIGIHSFQKNSGMNALYLLGCFFFNGSDFFQILPTYSKHVHARFKTLFPYCMLYWRTIGNGVGVN